MHLLLRKGKGILARGDGLTGLRKHVSAHLHGWQCLLPAAGPHPLHRRAGPTTQRLALRRGTPGLRERQAGMSLSKLIVVAAMVVASTAAAHTAEVVDNAEGCMTYMPDEGMNQFGLLKNTCTEAILLGQCFMGSGDERYACPTTSSGSTDYYSQVMLLHPGHYFYKNYSAVFAVCPQRTADGRCIRLAAPSDFTGLP